MSDDGKTEIYKISKALSEMSVADFQDCLNIVFTNMGFNPSEIKKEMRVFSLNKRINPTLEKKGNPVLDEIPECFINEDS